MAYDSPRVIVGIGASAGGIDAFKRFFENLPAIDRIAIVVVLHLSPGHESLLHELIGRWTSLPVHQITDGMRVEYGHIYVLPPKVVVTIEQRVLHLHERDVLHHANRPIDVFFSALAHDQRENAVGIVLSGTGSDGSIGLRTIKNHGGLTLVQGGGDTAPSYAGMPDSAISTGAVDLVLPVEAMPARLAHLFRPPPVAPSATNTTSVAPGTETTPASAPQNPGEAALAAIETQRLAICTILRDQIGHDFSQYKRPTFLRRVERRMQILQCDAEKYLETLAADPHEVGLLFKDLLIGVTSFFRDEETFKVVGETIMPALFEGKGASDRVRVWVSGCSTGEEAYSLAIMLREAAEQVRGAPKIEVFATDIDDSAIGVARNGAYPKALFNGMSPGRVARYFNQVDDVYTVTKDIRDICTFSTHSVIRDPPFSRMDLVACRNLLIYLAPDLQARVLSSFNYALRQRGFLLLGSSETVTTQTDLFEVINKRHSIFRSRGLATAPLSLGQATTRIPTTRAAPVTESAANVGRAVQRANNHVLDRYAPAFVLVDAAGQIVHHSVRTGIYLEAPVGAPTRNLIASARRGLRHELRVLLRKVIDSGEQAVTRRVNIEWNPDDRRTVTITAERLAEPSAPPLYLVVFSDAEPSAASAPKTDVEIATDQDVINTLERELRDAREQLQAVVEEYETAVEELKSSNEEMHSINEELQSTNEELDTSKEEIQSINEELQTVNAQLIGKVDELDRANSDLRNLFDNTRIPTIFLSPDLRVRSFTPAVADVYNLLPSDIGRPITDIVSRIAYTELAADVGRVIETNAPVERSVERLDAEIHYLMRILPYRAGGGTVDGVVVTFADVSLLVLADHHRMLIDELNHRVKNMLTVVISICMQTIRRAATLEGFSEAFLGRMHAMSRAYALVSAQNWTNVTLAAILAEELSPYVAKDGSNFSTDLPEVTLKPRSALPLSLVLHELATNAVKYGALSVVNGNISVTGTIRDEFLELHWTERGGPTVAEPLKRGFGTTLIERSMSHELSGEASIRFPAEGVEATLLMPIGTTVAT